MPRISSGSSSDDDTETDSDAEQSEDGENSKNGKKCAKFRLNLTVEEIKYRKKNFNSIEELLSKQVKCTCCAKELRIRIVNGSEVLSHPVLDVLLCKDCYKFYGNGDFSVDDDGTDKYCRWCGQGGTLYCCAECTCAFCKACIKRNLKRSILKDIESEDWKCFICYGKPLWDLRAICWAAKKYSAQMRKEQRLKNQKALEKLKEKRLNNTPKRKTTRSRESLRTETNEPEIIAIDSGSDDSGTTPKKLMNSSDSRKRKLFHENDTNFNSEGEERCEAVNHENNEKCDKSLKIPDRLDSEQNIKLEREGTSSEEEKGVPQESFALTRENTRQICRLLAEQLKDFIATGEIISDQANKILKKKVNKTKFKELLDVDKTVEKIQLLAELSVKNLEKAKMNTRTFYKQWRKDLSTKKRNNHAQDNTKKFHVNADCHVLVDKPPACVDATGKVIPTSKTTDLEMEVDCQKQVHSDRESSDREQCTPLTPNMLQATSTPYKEDEKRSEKDQNNSVVHNASSQSDEKELKAVSNSSLQSNDSMKPPQKSDTVREEDMHEDKSASSLKNEPRNLCEENLSETAVVISEMSTVILDEETDKHRHRKGNVDNCVNSDASTELLDLVASTKNHENDTLDSCQRDLDDAESQTTDKTDVCENDTIIFDYQEPLSSELIDTMESILAKVDGNISCPDIFANTEGKLPSSPCDPTEGKLPSSPCDPTEGKLQSSRPCDPTEEKLQSSPCDATKGKLHPSPCDATEGKLQSSPCDATEKKLQSSPCDTTEGELQTSLCDTTEGKLQSSPCDLAERKIQSSPCDPTEGKIQSSPCDPTEGKPQSSPCDPTEGKPQSSPLCDPHEDSLESDKENKYSTDALKTKEKLLEVSSEDNSDSDGRSCSDDETQKKKRKKNRRLSSRKQPGNLKVPADKNSSKKKKSGLRGLPSCSDSDSESSVDSVRITKYKEEKFKLDCLAQFNDEKLRNGCYVKLQRLTNFSNVANKCDVDNVSDKEKRNKSKNIISESDAESMDDDEERREIRRLLSLRALKKKSLKLNAELNDADSDSSKGSSTTKKEKKAKKEKKNDEEVESLLSVHKKVVDGDISPDSDTAGDGTCPISEKQSEKPRKQDDEDSVNHDKIAKLLLLHESSDSESSDSLHLEGQSNKSVVKKKKDVEENTIKKSEENVEEHQKESSLKEKTKEKNSLEPVENDEHQEEEKEILRGDEERKGSENEEDSCGGEHMASVKSKTKSESEEMPDNTEAEVKNQSKEGGEEGEEKVNKSAECKESKDKDKKSAEETEEDKPKKTWRSNKLLRTKLSETDSSEEERKWNAKKQKKEAEDSSDRKKKRRRIVDSDSCSDIKSGSESSDLEALFDTKRKRKRKSESSDIDSKSSSSSSSMEVKKKPKRRRVVVPTSNSSGSDSEDLNSTQKSEGTPGKGRKNIRRVLKDENVAEATKRAAREEEERKKRIAEKQKMYNALFLTGEANVEKLDKLVLDFDQETKQELITVHKDIVGKLKPHQVKGVKFMWDTCFESIQQVKESKGTGCILAHCMGLGKTLQVVTLVHTVLSHPDTCVKTVLVICPYSTIKNWVNEFHIWLKDLSDSNEIEVFELTRYKKNYERMYQLKQWHEEGGVMVMGYEMYRNLAGNAKLKARKQMIENFQTILVDPGPDLIVCDEGHLLKNENSAISKALRKIRTLRRIVLTGTPLQNNLSEYHCMVQFVKPNLLGSKKEFDNRFVNPIRNGQYVDSTLHDVKVMKRRAHVLHKMLESSVQRFDYGVLTPFLPPKHEYVISVRLSEAQVKLYRYYLDNFSAASELNEPTRGKGAKLFADFQALQRIWTHPRVIRMDADRKEKDEERKQMMASDSEGSLKDFVVNDTTSDSSDDSSKESGAEEADKKKSSSDDDVIEITEKENEEEDQKSSRWWEQFVTEEDMEDIKCSGKLMLLFYILQECEKIGDKVLVFSQSLLSLDLIEYFLGKIDESTQQSSESEGSQLKFTGSWSPGLDYFRLDGSTSAENRNIWCKNFNKESNFRARLFLISTRAGGLGINLVAANRVVLFDASWNPSHDVQSIFRIYRFGQKKPCYVYRLLAQGTMEEKIYDRQVTKLSLSCRVVDEQQIERHYNMADLQEMYMFDPEQVSKRPTPVLPKDRLLAELLKEHEYWVITYHEHDSLLQNKEEEELNEEERKAAWEEYENEKKPKIPAPTFAFMNQNMGMHQGSMGPLQIPPNLLREMLKRENPQATEPQLNDRLNTVINNISTLIANNQLIGGTEYEGYLNLLRQHYMQEQLRKESQLAANERYMNASHPVQPQYSNYYINQGGKPAQLTYVRKEVTVAPSTSKTMPGPKIQSYGQVRAIGPKKVYAAPIKSYGAKVHGLQKENTVNTVSSIPQQQTPSDDSIEIID